MASLVTRRTLLALGAASAVLLVPSPLRAALPPPKARFGDDDLDVIAALARVLYGPGADALSLRTSLPETLGFLDEGQQALLASLPSTFDLLSRALVPTVHPFVTLSEAQQGAALNDWLHSRVAFRRQIGQALRQLVLSHCYTDETVYADIAYPGPWLGRHVLPIHPLRFGEPE